VSMTWRATGRATWRATYIAIAISGRPYIEMRDVAQVVLSRHHIDAKLAAFLRSRGKKRASSHGGAVQVDSIKTRVESAYGFRA
jgi:hypothetical protein